ncbi:glycosyltransferase family 4 protein [Candidatus Pristimantibacillus sp. PTI5]|uniref:glycosyltransferase family 4 protein n=1 Tax=Candidatus Pristimantibacillus sp. PTI5 TaxID=3400422 RepID=UPI003B01D30F
MLFNRMNIGGTEYYVLNLARALKRLGVHVGIAAHSGPLTAEFLKYDIPVHLFPPNAKHSEMVSMLTKTIKTKSYQLIHAHDTLSYRLTASLLRISKVTSVLTVHGRYHGVPPLLEAAKGANKIIVVTQRLQAWVRSLNIPASKVVHIPIGIDTVRFSPQSRVQCRRKLAIPQGWEVTAYASRFDGDKYPIARKVISAGEVVALKREKSIFVLAGPGAYRKHLIKQAETANRRIGRRAIIVKPAVRQIQFLYGAADVIVATGTVANEAMSCGKTIIAAGVKGYFGIVTPSNLKESLSNQFGDHGGKDPVTAAKLARDIGRVLSNQQWAKELGAMGRKMTVHRYSVNNVSRRIRSLYIQTVKKGNT